MEWNNEDVLLSIYCMCCYHIIAGHLLLLLQNTRANNSLYAAQKHVLFIFVAINLLSVYLQNDLKIQMTVVRML